MSKRYGFIGWREFLSTRKEILNEVDRAKAQNSSRPVKTEHGNAGEAEFRRWLSDFLPEKYGVTSGYIIPDVMAPAGYSLRHFDVIIYDRMNSPKLWIDGNRDKSDQGRSKAIPAKQVHAVFECKASFGRKSAVDAIGKLAELNEFFGHLPEKFTSAIIFFDLDSKTETSTLKKLVPTSPIVGYWGGLILRSDISEEACGNYFLAPAGPEPENRKDMDIPIVINLDDVKASRDEKGNVVLGGCAGGGSMVFVGPDRQWHFGKQYGPMVCSGETLVILSWSYNGFARFSLDLLNLLEGKPLTEGKGMFGQVFDLIE